MRRMTNRSFFGPALLYFMTFVFCVSLAAVPSCGAGVDCKDPKNAARVECTAPKVPQAFIDCAKADIAKIIDPATATTLLAKVVQILVAGGDGWQQALESLGTTVGADVLACAVQAADIVFTAQSTPVAGSGSAATAAKPPAAARAEQLITAKGWKFAP